MIYESRPDNFKPKFEVVGCFVRRDNSIILLHRQDNKPQGGTWGIPSGKVDNGESLEAAMIREIREEIGWEIKEENLDYFSSIDVSHNGYDFVYHMFGFEDFVDSKISISNHEHKEARWVDLDNVSGLPLIEDLDECIRIIFGRR
jgi:8-oxo-dGTP pyrophosphatase MutT (NUDIX family)